MHPGSKSCLSGAEMQDTVERSVIDAARLTATAVRLRDQEALVTALRLLARSVVQLEALEPASDGDEAAAVGG